MAVFIIRSLNETPFNTADADVRRRARRTLFGYGHVERFYQLGITTGCAVGTAALLPVRSGDTA